MSTPANRVIAFLVLLLLWPLLAVVALAVRLRLGSPVLFVQTRPGIHGQPFDLVKFRTMNDRRGPDGELLPDADRLTAFGRLLRSTSLDELPELWNVLRGEMHLVGPRPWLLSYVDRFTPGQARRMDVPPGITGLAQVSGRNNLGWDERIALDVQYVDTRSVRLDLAILARTVWKVVRRDDISEDGHATATLFEGTSEDPPA